jgi:uncharacterized repeat protein (TIGR01451 family)
VTPPTEPTTPVMPLPTESPNLDISKTGPEQARIGEEVTFEIVVTNTGNVELEVKIEVQTLPESDRTEKIAAGGEVKIPVTLTVPETTEDRVDTVVMVTGTTASGRTVSHSLTHALRIDRS